MYIFGYGSIINRETRTKEGLDDIPVRLYGYARDWNVRIDSDNATALGITKSEDSQCNGLLVPVSYNLLEEFDKREDGYKRILLQPKDFEFLISGNQIIDKIYTYVPTEPLLATEDYPMEQTYIDVVLYGCFEQGESFLREFISSTRSWNYPKMNDRDNPNYHRWCQKYVSDTIDKIFANETKDL